MLFGYLILFISVIISAIAAYYSVVGLAAIFAAAVVPVMIMGGALEAGKIVATVWLHNNWKRAGVAFKLYLVPAIVFLMLLTSMGIFGFLSKAHGDQSLVSGDAMAKVAIFDEKIRIAKDNIDANRKALKQMDEAVDQVMGRSSDEKGADKAVSIRRSQQKERVRLQSEIQAEQKTITALSEEAAPLRAEFRKVEAEVGPIKYIAALIYGDAASQNMLEAAVRWVIILIVVVFDPLALCLILAGNKQLEWARHGRGGWVHDEEPVEEKPAVDEPAEADAVPTEQKVTTESTPTEESPLTEEEREAKEQQELEEFLWRGKMIAKALDTEEAERAADEANKKLAEIEPELDIDQIQAEAEEIRAEEAQLKQELVQQQELLETLATEFETVQKQLDQAKTDKTDLESKLAQSEQLKADLKVAYDATAADKQNLADQKAVLDKNLYDAGNSIARLRLDIGSKEEEIEKLNGWVDQLQRDLQQAIALAEERNRKVNELSAEIAQLNPPPEVFVEEIPTPVVVEEQPVEPAVEVERPGDYLVNPDTTYDANLGFEQRYFTKYAKPDSDELAESGDANFGAEFPATPEKGDMFMRVDYLPTRLYKFNGNKWIEIDKNTTDRLVYNQAYLEHLISKIRSGEYDVDDLSDAERLEIEQYLRDNNATL
jgi:hypothetical protein